MPEYPQTRLDRAVTAAITADSKRPRRARPLCLHPVDGAPCGLAWGHEARSGTPHQSYATERRR